MLKVVHDETEASATTAPTASSSLLDEIVRDGARQMLAAARRHQRQPSALQRPGRRGPGPRHSRR